MNFNGRAIRSATEMARIPTSLRGHFYLSNQPASGETIRSDSGERLPNRVAVPACPQEVAPHCSETNQGPKTPQLRRLNPIPIKGIQPAEDFVLGLTGVGEPFGEETSSTLGHEIPRCSPFFGNTAFPRHSWMVANSKATHFDCSLASLARVGANWKLAR
jgi:hypothetical protein